MIKFTWRNGRIGDSKLMTEDTLVRDAMAEFNVEYIPGYMLINGDTMHDRDLDKTLADVMNNDAVIISRYAAKPDNA